MNQVRSASEELSANAVIIPSRISTVTSSSSRMATLTLWCEPLRLRPDIRAEILMNDVKVRELGLESCGFGLGNHDVHGDVGDDLVVPGFEVEFGHEGLELRYCLLGGCGDAENLGAIVRSVAIARGDESGDAQEGDGESSECAEELHLGELLSGKEATGGLCL